MIVIACLDDNGGMMFNHRRQSQDRMLRAHIAALVGDARLWMNHYSAQQFDAESIQHLNVDDASCRKRLMAITVLLKMPLWHHLNGGLRRSSFSDGTEPTPLISTLILTSPEATGKYVSRLSLPGTLTSELPWRFI